MRNRSLRILPWLLFAALLAPACDKKDADSKQPAPSSAKPAQPQPAAVELPGAWEPDVRANLLKLIADHGKGSKEYDAAQPPVVVFDFDNTCIRGDIGRAFYDFMIRERKILFDDAVWQALPDDKRPAIQAAWNELSALPADQQAGSAAMKKFRKAAHQAYWSLCHDAPAEKCYPWQVRFYAGYAPSDITRMAHDVMKAELTRPLGSEQIRIGPDDDTPAITSKGIRVYPEIRELMFMLRREGFKVWVVTAGPQWVVEGAAKHFAVAPGQVIGMRAKLKDGKLTSEIDPPPTFKEGKVQAIEKFIKVKPVLVLGDSWTDAEMMAYARHALLIDRGYADLKKKAVDAGWWIQPAFPVK